MKPNSFVLGVVELFAVFLPGVVVAGALVAILGIDTSVFSPFAESPEVAALVLIAVAYLCGALLNAAASELLDAIFERNHGPGPKPGADEEPDATWARLLRVNAELENEDLVVPGHEPNNPFRAVRAYLHLALPRAAAEVERLEAEQKLFRTMSLGACIVGVVLVARAVNDIGADTTPWLMAGGVSFIACVLSYKRYAQLRLKTLASAYTFFLSRHAGGVAKKPAQAHTTDGEEE